MVFIDLDRKKVEKIMTYVYPNCKLGPEVLIERKVIKGLFYFITDAAHTAHHGQAILLARVHLLELGWLSLQQYLLAAHQARLRIALQIMLLEP